MTTTPDPKTVREIATEHILDDARRAHDIGAAVLGHFGPDALSKAEYHAYCDAIRDAITTATVAVSWPAERAKDKPCPCGCPTIGNMCDCGPDPCGCSPDPGCAFCDSPNDPPRPKQLQDERDGEVLSPADVPDEWLQAAFDAIGHSGTGDGNEQMRNVLAAVVPLAARREQNGDVQAVAEAVVRLKRWLAGRQANVHPEIPTTSVVAEPRDRTTAAWAIAESDVRAVVAALDARDAKAGEQR